MPNLSALDAYRQRNPRDGGYYKCVESHYEELERFSIPKRRRIYFLYDRKLLSKLSRCGWNVIRACFEFISSEDDPTPGASIAVHTYGDFLNFNPHLHAIAPGLLQQ